MAGPKFLSKDEVYRILQRESPPDSVYPDGSPSGFFSNADNYAASKTVADSYSSLKKIYENYYPLTATDRLPDHEFTYFGYTLDGALSIEDRRAMVLGRLRTRLRPTKADIEKIVTQALPPATLFEVIPWGCGHVGWVLDESQLEIETILNEFNGVERVGPNLCQLDAADYGMTQEEFLRLHEQAYTYEVRIYDYTLTATQRSDLDAQLTKYEPARSQHLIFDDLDSADMLGGST